MRQSVLFVIALTGVLGCATTRGTGVPPDATALEHVLDEWAIAWSSSQVERLLPLFTDDVYYEDVTLGAVIKSKEALRNFGAATFGAFADLRFEAKSRFVAANGKWGSIECVFTGRASSDQ
jgi:ketosteroid isomerase-like protein